MCGTLFMLVSEPSVGRELVYQFFESIRFIKMSMGIRCCTDSAHILKRKFSRRVWKHPYR